MRVGHAKRAAGHDRVPAVVVARETVGTAVRNGGFAPLLLDPVDFVALYRQRVAATQAEQAVTPTA